MPRNTYWWPLPRIKEWVVIITYVKINILWVVVWARLKQRNCVNNIAWWVKLRVLRLPIFWLNS